MKKIYTYEYKINFVKSFLKSQQADNELSIAGFAKRFSHAIYAKQNPREHTQILLLLFHS